MSNPLGQLTNQQRNVLQLIASGQRETEVAASLGIKTKTVKFHKTAIYKALGVRSLAEATIIYQKAKAERQYEAEFFSDARNESYLNLKTAYSAQGVKLAQTEIELAEVRAKLAAVTAKYEEVAELRSRGGHILPIGRAVL